MSDYDAATRPLPFPLKNPLTIIGETEDDAECEASSFVWPIDSDERVLVPFALSLNEYNVLSNTIDVGRDIAYGEDSIKVLWLWLRNMRCDVPICAAIIACITGDEDTQAAFRAFVLNDPAIQEYIQDIAQEKVLSLEKRLTNLLKPEVCAPSYVFNQASALVELCDSVTIDIFEAIEVGSNQAERADIFVRAFPAAGFEGTAATIFSVVDQIVEEVTEDYAGAYDEALYDSIRCAVFCACKDDCQLSIEKAITVYETLLTEELPSDPVQAFLAVLQFIIAGDFATDAPVYIMHLLVLTAIRLSQDVLGIDFGALANRIYAAGDEADNDWEVLCTDCAPPPPDECENPDNFIKGSVTSQSGLEFNVTAVYDSGSGYYYIEWGDIDCEIEPCYGFEYEFTTGALNDAYILGASCTSISLVSLPQNVFYFYFRNISPFSMKITFGA